MVLEDWVVHDTVTQRCKNIVDNDHCKKDDQSNLTSTILTRLQFLDWLSYVIVVFSLQKRLVFCIINNTLTKPR